ncbi:MAG: DOMON-like domain-containing protein [Desulfobacterales bacterium]|nr:DOMON-like domain-containing protein [Desulfobacterales bacterium]
MSKIDFKLQPFSVDPHGTGISIEGSVRRDGGTLSLEYRLQGRLDNLSIPPISPQPRRRHELWKGTCFEGFIQPAGSSAYWELNLSPAGHWNLYRFDGYRQGMREEPAIVKTNITVKADVDRIDLHTEVNLGALGIGSGKLAIGLSAVIRALDGHLGYWALTHPDTKPDFHHPRSFVLGL